MIEKPVIFLMATQMPQQELSIIVQVLQTQGFERPDDSKTHPGVFVFETKDKANSVTIRFYQEIGAMRLELRGPVSRQIGQAIGQYMPPLTITELQDIYNQSNSSREKVFATMLMVLAYPDATSAMAAMHEKYFDHVDDNLQSSFVQGLAFMESPDVGVVLEQIEKDHKGEPIAELTRKAIDGLSAQGIIRESTESFKHKILGMIDEHAKEALELIEKYEADLPAPEIRALHAKVLRVLGKLSEANELVKTILPEDPDLIEALCERALLLESSGHIAAAQNDVESALRLDPANAEASEILKRLSLVLNEAQSSDDDKLKRYTQALEATPDDVNLRCQRGECLLNLNRAEDALIDIKTASKLAPNDPRIPLLMAECYLSLGMLGSALDYATKAQKNHVPTQELAAWLIRPRVFMAIGLPEKALSAIHEIPAEIREQPTIQLCQGIVLEQLGQTADAENYYSNVGNLIKDYYTSLQAKLYTDLPILRKHLKIDKLTLSPKPEKILDKEPVDPFFKRCDNCGALTMKRRTFCKECNHNSFFE